MVPTGTYSVALLIVFKLNVLPNTDDVPRISNGFSIRETTELKSIPAKALLPMLVIKYTNFAVLLRSISYHSYLPR